MSDETVDMPDHTICKACFMPMHWDDWGYTHDHSGFAECGVRITGGEVLKETPNAVLVRATRIERDLDVTTVATP